MPGRPLEEGGGEGEGVVIHGQVMGQEAGRLRRVGMALASRLEMVKNAVDDKQVSSLSPMPANFGDQIMEKDFYDLLAYLLAQRAGGK